MSDDSQSSNDATTSPCPQDQAPPANSQSTTKEEQKQVRHALRTPINHILGYCELLLEEHQVPETFRRDLERIQAGGRQLMKLINEYFDRPGVDTPPRDLHRLYHELRTPVT